MPELKVTSQHLEHDAYLYIRQSTPRQVLENTESTQRQYALRDRAVALGWPLERIHVLDCDLGKSGSQSAGRDGFRRHGDALGCLVPDEEADPPGHRAEDRGERQHAQSCRGVLHEDEELDTDREQQRDLHDRRKGA